MEAWRRGERRPDRWSQYYVIPGEIVCGSDSRFSRFPLLFRPLEHITPPQRDGRAVSRRGGRGFCFSPGGRGFLQLPGLQRAKPGWRVVKSACQHQCVTNPDTMTHTGIQ